MARASQAGARDESLPDGRALQTILVVDDEPELRDSLKLLFELEGHSVETAHEPREALQVLRTRPVDVVLSDVRMPNGGGLELLRALQEAGLRIPLVFMTAFADLTRDEALRRGAADLIAKPFDFTDLVQRIVSICPPRG